MASLAQRVRPYPGRRPFFSSKGWFRWQSRADHGGVYRHMERDMRLYGLWRWLVSRAPTAVLVQVLAARDGVDARNIPMDEQDGPATALVISAFD